MFGQHKTTSLLLFRYYINYIMNLNPLYIDTSFSGNFKNCIATKKSTFISFHLSPFTLKMYQYPTCIYKPFYNVGACSDGIIMNFNPNFSKAFISASSSVYIQHSFSCAILSKKHLPFLKKHKSSGKYG